MTKPVDPFKWADQNPGGITDPGGKKNTGWVAGEKPPASVFNWIHNTVQKWLDYFVGWTDNHDHKDSGADGSSPKIGVDDEIEWGLTGYFEVTKDDASGNAPYHVVEHKAAPGLPGNPNPYVEFKSEGITASVVVHTPQIGNPNQTPVVVGLIGGGLQSMQMNNLLLNDQQAQAKISSNISGGVQQIKIESVTGGLPVEITLDGDVVISGEVKGDLDIEDNVHANNSLYVWAHVNNSNVVVADHNIISMTHNSTGVYNFKIDGLSIASWPQVTLRNPGVVYVQNSIDQNHNHWVDVFIEDTSGSPMDSGFYLTVHGRD